MKKFAIPRFCTVRSQGMSLSLLFLGVLGFVVAPAAHAQLSFTISPVAGHTDQYTLAVTSGYFTTPSGDDQTSGSITTDSAFFSGSSGDIISGSITTYSSGAAPEPIVTSTSMSGSTLSFNFGDNGHGEDSVIGGTGYGLTGSVTVDFVSGSSYADLTPGTYNIVSGGGAFGDSANYGGTLTVEAAAVPEPVTCAAVFGVAALGVALWRRRRARSLA